MALLIQPMFQERRGFMSNSRRWTALMRWIAYLEATKTEINFEKLKLKVAELKIFPTGRGKVVS